MCLYCQTCVNVWMPPGATFTWDTLECNVATRVYPIQYVGVCQRVAKQLNAEIFQTLTVKITQIPVA